MRLSFSVVGDQLICALEAGPLSYKHALPFDRQTVLTQAGLVESILARGNTTTVTQGNN